jgi:hypothetical protein
MKDSVVFARIMEEHGSRDEDEGENDPKTQQRKKMDGKTEGGSDGNVKKGADLMQLEERNIGAVTWDVYKRYLRFGGGLVWAPIIIALLALTQGTQGTSLGFLCELLFRGADGSISSRKQPRSRFLDITKHTWIQAERLYGGICRLWCGICVVHVPIEF